MPSTGEGAGRHWPSNFLEYLINGHLMNRLFGGVKARNLDFRKKKVGFSDAALWISNLLAKGMALQRCNQCIFLSHVATKLYNPTSCGASARHRPPPFSRFFFSFPVIGRVSFASDSGTTQADERASDFQYFEDIKDLFLTPFSYCWNRWPVFWCF